MRSRVVRTMSILMLTAPLALVMSPIGAGQARARQRRRSRQRAARQHGQSPAARPREHGARRQGRAHRAVRQRPPGAVRRRLGVQERRLRDVLVGSGGSQRRLLQPRRICQRRHLQPGGARAAGVRAGAPRDLPRRGRARDLRQHPGVQGRHPRRQQRALRRQRRRRLRPLRRHRPGQPEDPDPGRRGPLARRRQRPPGPRRGAAVRPQHLHLAGRPARIRRHRRQQRAARRRHLRHHRADEPRVHRRPRPRRAVSEHRRRERQRRRRLPPRRGRQEHRRRADDARLLLGRGLRQAQRQRSGAPAVPRRHDLRRAGQAAGIRPAGGQRPPGRVLARQPLRARRRRGLQPLPRGRVLDHDRPARGRVPGAGGQRRDIGRLPARSHPQRPGRLRRLRLRRVGGGAAALVGEPRRAGGRRGGDPRPAARPDGRPVRHRGSLLPGREGGQRHRGGLGCRAARQPPSRRCRERRAVLRLGRLPARPADRDGLHDA